MADTNKPLKEAVVAWLRDHRKTFIELAAGFVAGLVVGILIS